MLNTYFLLFAFFLLKLTVKNVEHEPDRTDLPKSQIPFFMYICSCFLSMEEMSLTLSNTICVWRNPFLFKRLMFYISLIFFTKSFNSCVETVDAFGGKFRKGCLMSMEKTDEAESIKLYNTKKSLRRTAVCQRRISKLLTEVFYFSLSFIHLFNGPHCTEIRNYLYTKSRLKWECSGSISTSDLEYGGHSWRSSLHDKIYLKANKSVCRIRNILILPFVMWDSANT